MGADAGQTLPRGRAHPHTRWRAFAILGVLAVSLAVLARDGQTTALSIARRIPAAALGHAAAAAEQQGQPTNALQARAAIDRAIARARDGSPKPDWGDQTALGDLLLARARLTGSFEDYGAAGRAFDAAFRAAPPGVGPHLERAGLNLAIHRLAAVEPDLVAIDHYAIPDDADLAAVMLMRGDLQFYAGQYRQARNLYAGAQARMGTLGGDLRLANYYARTGDPARAAALLDQAQGRISGPQQQMLAFIEMRRGALDLGRGRWEAAEKHFRRADDIFPGYWPVEMQLATVRALRGAPGEALAIFRRVADRDGLPDAYDGMAGIHRASGDIAGSAFWASKAGTLWDQRLALLPEAALGHALDHVLAFGDPARALALAQQNYALRPYGDAATGLAWAYLANQRPVDALAAIGPTLASVWASADAHVVASEVHALLGQVRDADAERRAALAINPHSFDRNPGMIWLEQ